MSRPCPLLLLAVLGIVAAPARAGLVGYDTEASFLAVLTNPLHESFDSYGSGSLVTALPAVHVGAVSGVNFNGIPVSQFVTAQEDLPFSMLAGQNTSSLPNLFSNDLSGSGGFATGTITFEFIVPMNAIGFFVADGARLDPFRIELYSNDELVGVVHSDGPKVLPNSFLGVTSLIAFDRAMFGSTITSDSWGIDDLYTQAAPSPGGLALLALAVLTARRRRR